MSTGERVRQRPRFRSWAAREAHLRCSLGGREGEGEHVVVVHELLQAVAGCNLPDTHFLVHAARSKKDRVGSEGERINGNVASQSMPLEIVGQIPYVNRGGRACGREKAAIAREGHCLHLHAIRGRGQRAELKMCGRGLRVGAWERRQLISSIEAAETHPSIKAQLLSLAAVRQVPCGDLTVVTARSQKRAL